MKKVRFVDIEVHSPAVCMGLQSVTCVQKKGRVFGTGLICCNVGKVGYGRHFDLCFVDCLVLEQL